MTAPRFLIALAVVLGIFVFFFWRMQPETRVDQVITTGDPSAQPLSRSSRSSRLPLLLLDAGARPPPSTD